MSVATIAPGGPGSPQLAELLEQGLVARGTLAGPVGRASERLRHTGVDRVLPLRPELCPLLPWRGLRRGATLSVATEADERSRQSSSSCPAGSTTLLLALIAEAVRTGSWCGVLGVPALGARAAADMGIDLSRLALVPYPGTEWVTVAAALLDGLDIVVVCPPGPVAPTLARRLAARAKQRGAVLVSYGSWPGAEVTLRADGQRWYGLGAGRGRLRTRELDVVSYGRGAATRHRRARLTLPGNSGGIPEPFSDVSPRNDVSHQGRALSTVRLPGAVMLAPEATVEQATVGAAS